MRLLGLAAALSAFLLATSAVNAQLQITEIHYNSTGGTERNWEFVEVRNAGATPIDFGTDGWFGEIGDTYRTSFNPNITSAAGGPGPIDTVIPAGGTAVLFDGFSRGFDDTDFRTAWGLDTSVQLIQMQFKFPPFLGNGGGSFGIWGSRADIEADSDLANEEILGYDNALASVFYESAAPWPTGADGVSVEWSGNGSFQDGANWIASADGARGATTSAQILEAGATAINSANDLGSPGVVPLGPAATGLIISEIMYNPASSEVTQAWEWVEVHNNTGAEIDFAATPYYFDDDDAGAYDAPNLTSGSIPNGGTAVIFNNEDNTLENMQAAWGDSINFIPAEIEVGLSNTADGIGFWNDQALYEAAKAADDFSGALSFVEYDDGTIADPQVDTFPTETNVGSIYLTDLSLDQTVGANWLSAGGINDFDSFNAMEVLVDGTEVHPGGDIGSPGTFEAIPLTGLAGDYNNDGTVDAADYTIWRDGGALLNETETAGTVTQEDYTAWATNYGATVGAAKAVPEPAAAMLLVLAGAGALARRRD